VNVRRKQSPRVYRKSLGDGSCRTQQAWKTGRFRRNSRATAADSEHTVVYPALRKWGLGHFGAKQNAVGGGRKLSTVQGTQTTASRPHPARGTHELFGYYKTAAVNFPGVSPSDPSGDGCLQKLSTV